MGKNSLLRSMMAAVVIVVVTASATANAEPTAAERETARTLMEQGDTAFGRQDYAGALKSYQAADELVRVPTTGLAVAKAMARLGKLVEARDTALRVTRIPASPGEAPVFASAREEAEQLAAELAPRIPALTINIEGAPRERVRVTVDGNEFSTKLVGVAFKLNPGKHVVVASAPGFSETRGEVTLAESASEKLVLRLRAMAAPKSGSASVAPEQDTSAAHGTSPLVYIGFGVGAAGIIVGSVTGIMSLSKASSVGDQCDGNTCPTSAKDDADSGKTLANVSNVAFGVGLIGIGLGVYGLLSSRSEPSEQKAKPARTVEPLVGAGFVGLHGFF